MTSETRAALEVVSDLRRRGLISTTPPTPQPELPSLADHAHDRQAFLACIQPTALRVITMGTTTGRDQTDCQVDPMICDCTQHHLERAQSIRRQRLAADPFPIKRRIAA